MRRRGWWHIPVMLLLAAALLVTLLVVEIKDREDKQKTEEIRTRAAVLEKQRDELVARRDKLEREYWERARGAATEQLLFLELDEQLYSQVFPVMQQAGIPGVLGLSEGNFPGDPGKISRTEFDSLLENGWGLCLVCEDSENFAQWDQTVTERLAREGIEKPVAVYFPEDSFYSALEEEVLACGYAAAIHHGEDRSAVNEGEIEGGLWLPRAHPWNYSGVRNEIESMVAQGGENVFTLRFSEGREQYETNPFTNMLNFIEPFLSQGSLRVTGFEEALQLRESARQSAEQAAAEWEQTDLELAEQIRALNEQIQAVYGQWSGD